MKLKNMWKRFWTLDVHNHEGFTLVELIIVIAILAILSTGAIAGYSAYVESANKTADKAMIAEIENVLLMAYYNGDITENGRVVLSPDSDAVATNSQIEKVLADAYGANWPSALKLKYADWNPISDSSFNGAQGGLSGLVGTVDTLTGALAGFLDGDDIETFAPGFDTMGAEDAQGMANAAVFYVADVTGKMSSEDVTNAKNAMIQKLVVEYDPEASDGDKTQLALAALAEMNKHNGESTIGSAALMYAMATGYAEYAAANGNDGPKELLADRTDELKDAAGEMDASSDAFISLFDTFTEMIHGNDDNKKAANDYAKNALQKDAEAYVDAMKTVSSSKNVILENDADISKSGYFSNGFVTGLLDSYAEGGVFVYIMSDSNGEMQIYSTIEEKK